LGMKPFTQGLWGTFKSQTIAVVFVYVTINDSFTTVVLK
jgi:hypothetical protein